MGKRANAKGTASAVADYGVSEAALRVIEALGGDTSKPPADSFTSSQYASILGVSDQAARFRLRALVKAGTLAFVCAARDGKSCKHYYKP